MSPLGRHLLSARYRCLITEVLNYQTKIMQLSEFIKAPRGTYAFDFWIHPIYIPSVLSLFSIELRPDTGEPDVRMVDAAERLVLFMQTFPEKLLDKIYEHYLSFAEHSEWLADCNVPDKLEKNELVPYLVVRDIVVIREEDMLTLNSCFYVSPQWDTEHAIYLKLSGIDLEYCKY